jgi:hypothetical protein
MEERKKISLLYMKKYLEELSDMLECHVAEVRELIICYGKHFDVCRDVMDHLLDGEEGCPTAVLCYACQKNKDCIFNRTYEGNLNPKTDMEYHIALYHKWRTLILLSKIYTIINTVEGEVERLED